VPLPQGEERYLPATVAPCLSQRVGVCGGQAAIAADSRRYNVFTFLEEDGEGVDDVIKSAGHVTPDVDGAANDNGATPADDVDGDVGEISSPESLTATVESDTLAADGLPVTSSPAQSSEDVADLEFRGTETNLFHFVFGAQTY